MKKANLACTPLPVVRILGKFGSIILTRLQAKFDENLKFTSKFCGADGFFKFNPNLTKAKIKNRQNQAKTRPAIFSPTPALRRQILNSEIKKKEQINEPKFTKRPSLPARISSAPDVLAAT